MNCAPKYKATFLALAGICLALPASAQLHESINVDGRYVPDVIRIDRINAFPKALKSTLTSSPLNYESRGVAASFNPSLVILPATGWRSDRFISSNPGYLELGVGSWLNSTLSAGYRFIDNSTTLFGIRLQHNSTSLWKPEISGLTADEKQFRYDESIGLYASQIVKGYGRLDASLDYHLSYFNYYGFGGYESPISIVPLVISDVPTQTINDVAMRLDWRSLVSPTEGMTWNATARVRHFAYRTLPISPHYLVGTQQESQEKGARETNVGLEGGVRMPWDNGSSIGIDGNLDMMFLSNTYLDNYGLLTFTPYYRFSKGLLDVRVGADLDLAFNAGEKGKRYPFIHIAPDVRFGVQTGQVGVYLDVLGGSELMTLARLHQLDYYGMPSLLSTRPTFTPLDATFGINLGPFSGFSMGVKAGYKVTKNIPLGGWYTTWLNYGSHPIAGLTPEVDGKSMTMNYCSDVDGINLHGYSVSGSIGYEYGDVFSIGAEGSYQPQDGKKGIFNGFDRSRVTASANMAVRPVKPLKIGVSYDYRGVRKIYATSMPTFVLFQRDVIIDGKTTSLHSLDLPDITLLNLSASWDCSDNFSIWLQADNILNRHDVILPMQPTQGVVVVGGFKWLF
ncbi:MAG: hypothetical protein K2J63_06720 [Muribaculaceae bacterium]|nr:hypothetical protein [Muribaculaceae bacterium]